MCVYIYIKSCKGASKLQLWQKQELSPHTCIIVVGWLNGFRYLHLSIKRITFYYFSPYFSIKGLLFFSFSIYYLEGILKSKMFLPSSRGFAILLVGNIEKYNLHLLYTFRFWWSFLNYFLIQFIFVLRQVHVRDWVLCKPWGATDFLLFSTDLHCFCFLTIQHQGSSCIQNISCYTQNNYIDFDIGCVRCIFKMKTK